MCEWVTVGTTTLAITIKATNLYVPLRLIVGYSLNTQISKLKTKWKDENNQLSLTHSFIISSLYVLLVVFMRLIRVILMNIF